MAEDGSSTRGVPGPGCWLGLVLLPLVVLKALVDVTCEACMTLVNRWMDTTPSDLIPRFGFTHGSGTSYDFTPAAVQSRSHARYESWRQAVRVAVSGIRADCAAGRHHTEEDGRG